MRNWYSKEASCKESRMRAEPNYNSQSQTIQNSSVAIWINVRNVRTLGPSETVELTSKML